MNEEQIRATIREEVAKAFGVMQEAADWYASGLGEITDATAYVIRSVAERTVDSLTPAEPGPANPFAPKHTAQQWAEGIVGLIKLAEADGHEVWIDNRCCGCSKMTLRVGSGSESVAAFPEEE